LGQLLEREPQLVDVRLGLGLDGDRDDRLGERHPLEQDRVLLIAERVARARVTQADGRVDVARVALLELLALVGVHAQDAAEPLALAARGVHDRGAALDGARVNAEERQVPDERVVHDLERERSEGRVVRGLALFLLGLVVRLHALNGRDVERRGKVVHDRVEQELDALVLEGGAAEHRDELEAERRLADGGVDLRVGDLARVAIEKLVHDGVVDVGARLDQLLAELLALLLEVLRDRLPADLRAEGVLEDGRLHANEVDHTLVLIFLSDRPLHGHRDAAQALLHAVQVHLEIGAQLVELVDERDARTS